MKTASVTVDTLGAKACSRGLKHMIDLKSAHCPRAQLQAPSFQQHPHDHNIKQSTYWPKWLSAATSQAINDSDMLAGAGGVEPIAKPSYRCNILSAGLFECSAAGLIATPAATGLPVAGPKCNSQIQQCVQRGCHDRSY
jgi:hypothetical protein